jgi:hypothetical protein
MKASRREQRIIEKRWCRTSASWAIVYVTVLFMTVAAFQIRALVRQARIAAQTLAAIRKHLAVSDRAKIPYEPIIQSMKLHKFGQPDFCVTYQIMNTGRTEAHVFEQQRERQRSAASPLCGLKTAMLAGTSLLIARQSG